jgi:hypothetical protein
VVTIIERPSSRLAGFARVLTDRTHLAVILDVIVAPDARGTGVGQLSGMLFSGIPGLLVLRDFRRERDGDVAAEHEVELFAARAVGVPLALSRLVLALSPCRSWCRRIADADLP